MISVEILTYRADEIANAALAILGREFSFLTSLTTISKPPETHAEGTDVDGVFAWIFEMQPRSQDATIVLVSAPLYAVDHEIVAETRANFVVISTTRLTTATLPRVLRHQIGQVVGLSDHCDCVMSRYFVENPVFCIRCRAALLKRGIAWRDDTPPLSIETLPHGKSSP